MAQERAVAREDETKVETDEPDLKTRVEKRVGGGLLRKCGCSLFIVGVVRNKFFSNVWSSSTRFCPLLLHSSGPILFAQTHGFSVCKLHA